MFGERERPLMPAQFALRVAILSGVALVMFSMIFFRLWYLQVLSGDKYLKQAENNQVREITVRAPRGQVLDRNGNVLVDNRTALALQLQPTELPQSHRKRRREFERLGQIVGMSADEISKQLRQQTRELPANPVTLKRDVDYDLIYYLRENQDEFPGADGRHASTFAAIPRAPLRRTSSDTCGRSPRSSSRSPAIRGSSRATKSGSPAWRTPTTTCCEASTASLGPGGRFGAPDRRSTQADGAKGRRQPAADGRRPSRGGRRDSPAFVQHARGVRGDERQERRGPRAGSSPTFDPSVFTKPVIPQSTYDQLQSDTTGAPLSDRATQGLYPTGSTFKPITAVAALESGVLTPTTTIVDGGVFTIGGQSFENAGHASYGSLQLPQALQVSSDVFFYNIGADLYYHDQETGSDDTQQHWASELGIGRPTGIDLPAETGGLLPSPGWRNQLYKDHQTDRPWTVGDNVNLSVGQGDLQAIRCRRPSPTRRSQRRRRGPSARWHGGP